MMLRLPRASGGAVVDMQGTIGSARRPLEYARLFARLREDRHTRAVVLNIDSPGGAATGSEMMTGAVRRLAEEKPVAAFIGGVGASGAYMVASASSRIIALQSSIIGAIGVISYRPVVEQALERLGVPMHVTQSGRLKDMLSPFRAAPQAEQAKEQRLPGSPYALLLTRVAGRRRPPGRGLVGPNRSGGSRARLSEGKT